MIFLDTDASDHAIGCRALPGSGGKIWLVVLRLNVPVNNFSVISGRSHRFLGN